MGYGNSSVVAYTRQGEELRRCRDRHAVQYSRTEANSTMQRMVSEKCCNSCYAEQQLKAYSKNRNGQSASRLPYGPEPACRKNIAHLQRGPKQAAPGKYTPPKMTTHQPYLNLESEPFAYFSHEGMLADIPKDCILCLRWTSGLCGKKKKNATQEEMEAEVDCPYAHPDLSEVPPGVCPTYWFTGFCRFNRKEEMQGEGSIEEESFGCHGWAHFTRMPSDTSVSDNSSSDGEKEKKKSRRRPPSVCLSCHHAERKGGFPLLPGISCKMTVREREAALSLYSEYMKNYW